MMTYIYGNSYASMPQQQPSTCMQPAATAAAAAAAQLSESQRSRLAIHEAFLEELSRQMSTSSSTLRRRHSRSSQYAAGSCRTPGAAMRVVKPRSANNSPRSSSAMHARQRLHEASASASLYASPQQPMAMPQLNAYVASAAAVPRYDVSADAVAARPSRPVSWHPSNSSSGGGYVMPGQQTYQPFQVPVDLSTHFPFAYATPALTATDYGDASSMQPYTLSPGTYSDGTSPSTAFSPYSGNFETSTAGHHYSPNPWTLSPSVNTEGALFDKLPSPVDCPALLAGQQPLAADAYAEHMPHGLPCEAQTAAWSNDMTSVMVPRTPQDTYAAAEPAQARQPSEGSLAMHGLELEADAQPEGEILVGMGLYDPPQKEEDDLTLQNYRSSVAQLLGSACNMPEPTGKGLKLEDSWEPPENMDDEDDEDDEDDDDERDAEGEEQ